MATYSVQKKCEVEHRLLFQFFYFFVIIFLKLLSISIINIKYTVIKYTVYLAKPLHSLAKNK